MKDSKWFKAWFAFCSVTAVLSMGGLVWLLIYVVPHVVHMLDRIH